MAFLMSDVAAGSTAARTLQQNMYAGQYDKANIDAAAQETQIKLQQDQATLEKTKLSNLVSETNFKSSEESKTKLRALAGTPEFQTADEAQKLRLMSSVQMQSGDIENGAKTLQAAEIYDTKAIAVKQKQLDQNAQQIGNAYGVISAVPDDKVNEFVDRMPKESRDALISQVGSDNWNKMTGAEKKEAAKNLMLNAKGQMAKQLKDIELEKTEMLTRSRERIEQIRQDGLLNRKLTGGTDREMRDWKLYQTAQENIERSGKKPLEALDKAVETAQAQLDKAWLFDSREKNDYAKAVKARDDFKRNQIKKEINLATTAPDFPGKQMVIDNLKKELELFPEEDKPTPKTEASPVKQQEVKPAATVPSNKPAAPKFEEGKIYTDAKGNKAKYVNGKWEPQ